MLNVNNFLLKSAGIWNFAYNTTTSRRLGRTAMNVMGWIPVASLVAGVARLIVAGQSIQAGYATNNAFLKREGYVAIGRAVLEIFQVGIVCMPFDIICAIIRAVSQEGLKKRNTTDNSAPSVESQGTLPSENTENEPVTVNSLSHTPSNDSNNFSSAQLFKADVLWIGQPHQPNLLAALKNYSQGILMQTGGAVIHDAPPRFPPNFAEAVRCYQQAADAGLVSAWTLMGMLYQDGGPELEQNISIAKELYEQAAKYGSAVAQQRLVDLNHTSISQIQAEELQARADAEMRGLTIGLLNVAFTSSPNDLS
jgi:hypothetical protein